MFSKNNVKKCLAIYLTVLCVGHLDCSVSSTLNEGVSASIIMNWVLKDNKPKPDLLYDCGFYAGSDFQAAKYTFNKETKKLTLPGSEIILDDQDIELLYIFIHQIAQGDESYPHVKDVDGYRYAFDVQSTPDSRLYFIVTRSKVPSVPQKAEESKIGTFKIDSILGEKFFLSFAPQPTQPQIIVNIDGHAIELSDKVQEHLLKMKNAEELRPLVISKTEQTYFGIVPYTNGQYCRYRFVISYDPDKCAFLASSCYVYFKKGKVGQNAKVIGKTSDVNALIEEKLKGKELKQNDDPISASALEATAATAAKKIAAAFMAQRRSKAAEAGIDGTGSAASKIDPKRLK